MRATPHDLRAEAQLLMDRGLVTRGQRLVIRDLLLRAAEEIAGLVDLVEDLEDKLARDGIA